MCMSVMESSAGEASDRRDHCRVGQRNDVLPFNVLVSSYIDEAQDCSLSGCEQYISVL